MTAKQDRTKAFKSARCSACQCPTLGLTPAEAAVLAACTRVVDADSTRFPYLTRAVNALHRERNLVISDQVFHARLLEISPTARASDALRRSQVSAQELLFELAAEDVMDIRNSGWHCWALWYLTCLELGAEPSWTEPMKQYRSFAEQVDHERARIRGAGIHLRARATTDKATVMDVGSDQGHGRVTDTTTVSATHIDPTEVIMPAVVTFPRETEDRHHPETNRRYVAPMTTSAQAVAAALRLRRTGLGASRVNSLLYFCQGHHLAEVGEPLFAEPIYAVAAGAIVEEFAADSGAELVGEQISTVGRVLARYGNLSAQDLRTLIWAGDPWRLAAARPADARIEWTWLQDWFERAEAAAEPDEPKLSRQQMLALAERAENEPPGPGTVTTREMLQARIDAARRRASNAS